MEFDWDAANLGHIARHGVTRDEAEQAIQNDPLDLGTEVIKGERRDLSLGATKSGRVLQFVTTMRGERVRVVTAFPASRRLCDVYFKKKGM